MHRFAPNIPDHHWVNDGLISIDFDSLLRGRSLRGDRPGGTTGGGTAHSTYISGDPAVPDSNEFNIKIVFQGTWTSDLKNAFILAADTISDFILGDIPNAGTRRAAIDDITITAQLGYIDGAGGILGQTGVTSVRAGSFLPATATIQFDTSDASYYSSVGLFDDIALHEMLHTLGFGTIWSNLGLISGSGFNGPRANAVYPGSALIPLETDVGPGTDYSHWDEATFTNELMTGFVDDNNYLSYMTIASLGDLGYNVISGSSYVQPWFV